MIRTAFLRRLYDAANMQRWNDQARPVDMRELDKQAHKMMIAYVLGKYAERAKWFDWTTLIEYGLFELLHRIVVTDLKPQLYDRIRHDAASFAKLNQYVWKQIEPALLPLDRGFATRFKAHLRKQNGRDPNKRIIDAAHYYATRWEFDLIERTNPLGYNVQAIRQELDQKMSEFTDMPGTTDLTGDSNIKTFVDLCGQLRFQIRWSHLHRVPRTSVLGHVLIVAIISYFFSLEAKACPQRRANNFLTGLFHDLPEALTRDIINPVKKSSLELERLVKRYERTEMKKVYRLTPRPWHQQLHFFTENEFSSVVTVGGRTIEQTSDTINKKYNADRYNPRDGLLVKAADDLAAYMEAFLAQEYGIASTPLLIARQSLEEKYEGQVIGGIDLQSIYDDIRQSHEQ